MVDACRETGELLMVCVPQHVYRVMTAVGSAFKARNVRDGVGTAAAPGGPAPRANRSACMMEAVVRLLWTDCWDEAAPFRFLVPEMPAPVPDRPPRPEMDAWTRARFAEDVDDRGLCARSVVRHRHTVNVTVPTAVGAYVRELAGSGMETTMAELLRTAVREYLRELLCGCTVAPVSAVLAGTASTSWTRPSHSGGAT